MRISDWSSDVCSSDLSPFRRLDARQLGVGPERRLYAVKDGWIALVAEGAGVFDRLCLLAGAANAEALEPILSAQSTTAVIAMANAAGAFGVAAHKNGRASCRERVGQYV